MFPDAFDDVWIKVLRLGFVAVKKDLLAGGDFHLGFAFAATRQHDERRQNQKEIEPFHFKSFVRRPLRLGQQPRISAVRLASCLRKSQRGRQVGRAIRVAPHDFWSLILIVIFSLISGRRD